jgi:cytochrome c oxidase subunit III
MIKYSFVELRHDIMTTKHNTTPYYFVPGPSSFPLIGSAGMLLFGIGAASWVNGAGWAPYVWILGMIIFLANLYVWFSQSIEESMHGLYSKRIDYSYRWSMSWFIFSEIMFFAAFFGALFYNRTFTTEWLGNLNNKLLWPEFNGQWPNFGPGNLVDAYHTMGPWPIPTINTLLLLSSGLTLTYAHHALLKNNNKKTIIGLALTVTLGLIFLGFQAYEYMHAYSELNLKLSSGAYGSLFFLLTGFHGFHVMIGTIMLAVVLVRTIKGHFNANNHFAFEGAAWYWHFVDVVWLFLYIVVYWM